jgi:hypothetical protein
VPNTFTGEVNWVEIDVGKAAADADHQIDPTSSSELRWRGSGGLGARRGRERDVVARCGNLSGFEQEGRRLVHMEPRTILALLQRR